MKERIVSAAKQRRVVVSVIELVVVFVIVAIVTGFVLPRVASGAHVVVETIRGESTSIAQQSAAFPGIIDQ